MKVTVTVTINTNAKKAWEAYTLPQHITKWNFASDDWQCPSAENDLRAGGKYKARMEAKDGSFGFDFEAIYDEIIPLQKITYTMGDGRKATTTFVEQNNSTTVTTVFDAETENPVDMQQQGWQMILNNYAKHAQTL